MLIRSAKQVNKKNRMKVQQILSVSEGPHQ